MGNIIVGGIFPSHLFSPILSYTPKYCLQYCSISPKITTHTRPISKITTTYTNRHQTHPTFNPSCTRRSRTFNHHLHPRLPNHHWSSSPTTHQHSKSVSTFLISLKFQ
ncbi:hypothetical protein Hanom_Chr08g00733921 [Helianthus anomalus]